MKRLIDEMSNKVDMLVSAYKAVLQSEENSRNEASVAKKLMIIKESVNAINSMKRVVGWAEENLKDKGNAFHNNYLSIGYQYKVYMEIIFRSAVESNNTMFAKSLLEKTNKLMDFNGSDFFNNCPLNMAIKYRNKSVFDFLLNHSKENNRGVIVNFANDSEENKQKFDKVRCLTHNGFKYEASPLFTALSLFDKENKNCEFAYFVNAIVLKGGVDLPKTLYRDVPSMKNVIDFVEVYRMGIADGFDKCEYSDMKQVLPIVSQRFDLGYELAFGINIEENAPENYEEITEFSEITLYDGGDFDLDD